MEYAFLCNFDLLKCARDDKSSHPWAEPSGHAAMDCYFKIQQAHEEIQRLDLEIP